MGVEEKTNHLQIGQETENPRPPVWAERLLIWYCKPSILEDLQGDLNEYFDRNLAEKGLRKARLIYIIDVLKFFRLYTIRKPKFIHLLIHWLMLGSYIKTSGRNLVRNKLFSAINLIGLSVSMSVGLLIIAFITDLSSYDDFHEKKDSIYRITSTSQFPDQPPVQAATTSVLAGMNIRETIPGIEDLTILRRGFAADAHVGETVIPISGFWADEAFFNVFTFPMLEGNPATALKEPYTLVLTERSARKLFGETDALGKIIQFDSTDYTVTGIITDIPKNSHMRFEALVSFATVALQKPDTDGGFLSWESIFMNYAYAVLSNNTNVDMVQENLNMLSSEENAHLQNHEISLSLQPLTEIVLGPSLANPIGPAIHKMVIWVLGGLAFVVILSACFNYTNLSMARAFRRSREVGIRKVIGALKSHVWWQFITESIFIALLSLVFSFLLFLILRKQFLGLHPYLQELATLELSTRMVLSFIGFALIVGLLAGFFPALFFSRIKVMQVLKNVSTMQVFRHVNMRKALIVIQYTFSLIFITTTVIGYNQYKSFLNFDLGFSTENILNIDMQGNKSDLLVNELNYIPAVSEISHSQMITSLGSIYGMQMKYGNPPDSAGVWINVVDEHYLPLHKHQIIAGRNFNPKTEGAAETEVIVNERALKRFNIGQQNPDQAIGEMVNISGTNLKIIGVVKDFHYGTLLHEMEPVAIRYSAGELGHINVKIASDDMAATMEKIETIWKKIDQVHPLSASFYDDQIQLAYNQFIVMVKVIGFLAFLAVCIASMGLFGMVVFITETRMKEISIRKVMGASEGNMVYLLSKGFLLLIVISAIIAIPGTYLFFDKIILAKFAYHQPISLMELLVGMVSVMVLAILMIGSQTLKVALTNPAEVLKSE